MLVYALTRPSPCRGGIHGLLHLVNDVDLSSMCARAAATAAAGDAAAAAADALRASPEVPRALTLGTST